MATMESQAEAFPPGEYLRDELEEARLEREGVCRDPGPPSTGDLRDHERT